MKKGFVIAAFLVSILVCLFAFSFKQSTIIGRINPVDGAELLWAIHTNNVDSVKATTASDGRFSITVKPGTYRIVVIAKPPYKNAAVENVLAREGETADTGEITLLK
jgi:hypothetical protein